LGGVIAYLYLATDVFSRNDNRYHGYYFGLVKTDEGVLRGSGCYDNEGDFILLINNKKAKDPTYAELLDFLRADDTSELPYHYVRQLPSFYYAPEDRVNLDTVKAIVGGTISPTSPNMYADFAERLHNNAEIAGIRCGYVYLDMTGYTDPQNSEISSHSGHACNVFKTTDRGRIYIDDTGSLDADGPPNRDMIVDIVEVGQPYNPRFLFPSDEWIVPSEQMGTVTDVSETWDGDWNNKWLR